MENLELYNAFRSVPKEAQREIKGGRLNGKTDINPMWRIKALTEQFGACGTGWKYEIVRLWNEPFEATGEIAAFAEINLYFKQDGEWSAPIPGTGGSSFVSKERGGMYVSDECYKMALTDAISVSCKMLGVGADIYWEKDASKYDKQSTATAPKQAATPPKDYQAICPVCGEVSKGTKTKDGGFMTGKEVVEAYGECTKWYVEHRNHAG